MYSDMTYRQLEAAQKAVCNEITNRLVKGGVSVVRSAGEPDGMIVQLRLSPNRRYTIVVFVAGLEDMATEHKISRVRGAALASSALTDEEFIERALG